MKSRHVVKVYTVLYAPDLYDADATGGFTLTFITAYHPLSTVERAIRRLRDLLAASQDRQKSLGFDPAKVDDMKMFLICGVLRAVQFIHGHGVAHGRIRPDYFLIKQNGFSSWLGSLFHLALRSLYAWSVLIVVHLGISKTKKCAQGKRNEMVNRQRLFHDVLDPRGASRVFQHVCSVKGMRSSSMNSVESCLFYV